MTTSYPLVYLLITMSARQFRSKSNNTTTTPVLGGHLPAAPYQPPRVHNFTPQPKFMQSLVSEPILAEKISEIVDEEYPEPNFVEKQ